MRQRMSYWSCSKFANWLRGSEKPTSHSAAGWRQWQREAKRAHRIRFWLAEEGLDAVQSAIAWPVDKLYDIKYYINNRWVSASHALTAHPSDIKPGDWSDVGSRFLPCLFNELVDFVEIEKAWSNVAWSKEAREKYNPPFWSWGWFRWRTWRSPEAGIEHLTWETTLTNEDWLDDNEKHLVEPTHQAHAAKEILELYNWWKNIYPKRQSATNLSGWSDWCDARRERIKQEEGSDTDDFALLDSSIESEEDRKETRRILDLCQEIENQQEIEDTEMLVRLIKIRNQLWT